MVCGGGCGLRIGFCYARRAARTVHQCKLPLNHEPRYRRLIFAPPIAGMPVSCLYRLIFSISNFPTKYSNSPVSFHMYVYIEEAHWSVGQMLFNYCCCLLLGQASFSQWERYNTVTLTDPHEGPFSTDSHSQSARQAEVLFRFEQKNPIFKPLVFVELMCFGFFGSQTFGKRTKGPLVDAVCQVQSVPPLLIRGCNGFLYPARIDNNLFFARCSHLNVFAYCLPSLSLGNCVCVYVLF